MRSRLGSARAACAAALATLIVLTACAPTAKTASSGTAGTLVIGMTASDIPLLDTGMSQNEGYEGIRFVGNQLYDGLTKFDLKQGTEIPKIIPDLAESWEPNATGDQWTFHLRPGVKFHDGTPWDADAAMFNLQRYWDKSSPQFYPELNAQAGLSISGFQALKKIDDMTIEIDTKGPWSYLPVDLATVYFGSPTAIKKAGSNKAFAEHPIGTGPFKFVSWTRGDKLVLTRNDDYWGKKPALKDIIIKPIADNGARRQALQSGAIDGFDNVAPGDIDPLKQANFQILERPSFNVAYLGFNVKQKPLDNPKIRQAIAYALNREALIKAKYGPGAEVAKEFMPPSLFGYSNDVPTYNYDPAKAKQLIAESGVSNPTLTFWYPTNVSRPYMPDPAANFQAFKADLEAVGFKVVPKSAPWSSGYLTTAQAGKAPLYLLGWTGDFGDPDNFVGTFFKGDQPQFGLGSDSEISKMLTAAAQETDVDKRTADYVAANNTIMQFLPGVPYAHTKPGIALSPKVHGYEASPTGSESFAPITMDAK